MDPSIKTHKRAFDRDLRHIKLILAHCRHHLAISDWLDLVQLTKTCILSDKNEFFCRELPPGRIFTSAIEKVFEGFLEDQRLLAGQTGRSFHPVTRGRAPKSRK